MIYVKKEVHFFFKLKKYVSFIVGLIEILFYKYIIPIILYLW